MTKCKSISGFESLVNLEGCKTKFDFIWKTFLFESLVNLEGCKTSGMP